MEQDKPVTTRLNETTYKQLDEETDNKSEYIRKAIREKLGRPNVNSRVDQLEEEIEQLSTEISEIRSALLKASQHSQYDYEPEPGNLLNKNENEK